MGIDPRELRNALGRFATGVAVITTRAAGAGPVGLTVNSLSSVSLDPPLVAWSLGCRASCLPVFLASPGFAINILTDMQEDLARCFAAPRSDRFAGVAWTPGLDGMPLIKGCLAHLECRTVERATMGDHWLLLGAVERLAYDAGEPLIFFASRFGLPAVSRRTAAGPLVAATSS
jgi:flavin reductase (DIM6/NTAB) family NADH-FMN oxidoreductase RutF